MNHKLYRFKGDKRIFPLKIHNSCVVHNYGDQYKILGLPTNGGWVDVERMSDNVCFFVHADVLVEVRTQERCDRLRHITLYYDNGKVQDTQIRGTDQEILDYYLNQSFVDADEKTMRRVTEVIIH